MSEILTKGNFVLAKVNGVKTVLTSDEMQRLIREGYDLEVVAPT